MAEVALRSVEVADLSVLVALRTDPVIQACLVARHFDESEASALLWIDRASRDPDRRFLVIEPSTIGSCVGFVQIFNWSRRQDAVEVGFAVHPNFQSMGFGQAAVASSIRYLRSHLVNRVELDVRVDNHRAMRAYLRQGFVFSEMRQKASFEGLVWVMRMAARTSNLGRSERKESCA